MSDEPGGFHAPKPGSEHKLLQPFAGTFRAEVKLFMGSGDPVVQTGTMHSEFHCDGLYLHQNYTGDPAEGPFPAFLGRGYWGFNQHEKVYEGFWIDNASTKMQLETGTCDASGREWNMLSELLHPHFGQVVQRRSVIRVSDNDRHTMDSYMTVPGQSEMLVMQISYVRVN